MEKARFFARSAMGHVPIPAIMTGIVPIVEEAGISHAIFAGDPVFWTTMMIIAADRRARSARF